MPDLLIAITKFLSILLAGAFGILGLLTKFRKKNGKITKWGSIAVVGTVVSTMVAVVSQELDFRRQAQEQREANEKSLKQTEANSALLEQIARAVDPFNSFEVDAWLGVNLDTPELSAYRGRLLSAIDEAVKSAKPLDYNLKNGVRVIARERIDGGQILSVSVEPESPAFPNKITEPVAYFLLRYIDVSFKFYKNSDPDPINKSVEPDLEISLSTADAPSSASLEYDLEAKQFSIHASDMRAEPQFWQNQGNVLGVSDLYKMNLLIALDSIVVPSFANPINGKILENRSKLSLRTMLIKLPRGRSLWIRQWGDARYYKKSISDLDEVSLPYYEVVLPKL